MVRNRAAVLSLNNSVSSLFFTKVKSLSSLSSNSISSANLLHSNKTLSFLFKNISTSSEKREFYNENHVDHFHSHNPLIPNHHHQNPSKGFHRRDGDCLGLQQTCENGYSRNHGRNLEIQENKHGDYAGNANAVGKFNQNRYKNYGEDSRYPDAGTIEEFDDFCKRNEVKEAVEVLKVLERNGIAVDLRRLELLMQMCGEVVLRQVIKSPAQLHISTRPNRK